MKTNLENRIFKAILENINSIGKKNSNAIFEKDDRCPIFTIQATRLSKEYEEEESYEDMRYTSQTYYNEQRAIDAARDMADDLIDEDDVILISVFAGEEETLTEMYGATALTFSPFQTKMKNLQSVQEKPSDTQTQQSMNTHNNKRWLE